jgi:hypothetical protein
MTDHTVTMQKDHINVEHREAKLDSSRSNLTFSAKKTRSAASSSSAITCNCVLDVQADML